MKKLLTYFLIFLLVVSMTGVVLSNGNPGSIWTTRNDCGTLQQDVNRYDRGEKVYINGDNFDEGNYNWKVKGHPGGASCDSDSVVANGSYVVDDTGKFCFEAYTVENDDCGGYKVNFNGKKDNYLVEINAPVIPEFGVAIGIVTILSALGVFFVIRKR